MRILSITAGAAGMYCGSCLRDNAVAAGLVSLGHDVTLLPLYTPTLTDEPNVSRSQVLFGGISVYLQQRSPFFRKVPRLFDRLLDSPVLIRAVAGRSVSTDPGMLGGLTVSMLQGPGGALRREFDKLLEWLGDEPLPDVVNLPNSLLIGLAAPIAAALKRPVCCTLQGEELFLGGLTEPYRSQALELIRSQVRHVDRFIAVSHYCAAHMSEYLAIPRERISVVPLGINVAGHEVAAEAGRRTSGEEFRIGTWRAWRQKKGCICSPKRSSASARERRDPASGSTQPVISLLSTDSYLRDVQQSLERAGLAREFTYHGAVDRAGKLEFLRNIDVLSVPTTYDEPKGMFLLEAMASGVPVVVQPRRGAFIEVIERTGGGLLVEPDSAESLAEGLERIRHEPGLRAELGRRGPAGVREHYTVQRSADRLMEVYEEVTRS